MEGHLPKDLIQLVWSECDIEEKYWFELSKEDLVALRKNIAIPFSELADNDKDSRADLYTAESYAIYNGHLSRIQWLREQTISQFSSSKIALISCGSGHLNVFEWSMSSCSMSTDYARDCMYVAISNNHLPIVQNIMKRFEKLFHASIQQFIQKACYKGRPEIAKYLLEIKS